MTSMSGLVRSDGRSITCFSTDVYGTTHPLGFVNVDRQAT